VSDEIPPPCCTECGAVLPQLEQMRDMIGNLERDMRGKRAQISRLLRERDEAAEADPMYRRAHEIFSYWRLRLSPKAREFTGDRLKAVLARLHAGHEVDEIKRAIDGCVLRPYVSEGGRSTTGPPDRRYVELELICRNEANLARLASYVDAAEAEAERKAREAVVPPSTLAQMQTALERTAVLDRLRELRGWTPDAITTLGLGLDGDRIAFPIRDGGGALVGLHRYQPNPERRGSAPKMLAEGARDLFPAPESLGSSVCYLVEGEPDAVAAHSAGLPAVGVPGVAAWKDEWVKRFASFTRIYVCFDADEAGRSAADKRAADLSAVATVQTIDLAPERDDGYDIGALVLDTGAESAAIELARRAVKRSSAVLNLEHAREQRPDDGRTPFERISAALDEHDCRPQHRQPGHLTARCPNHDDRHPSLSVSEGVDQRCLLHCHAGCDADEVVAALDLEWRDLFSEAS
jgi:hypothetical protein